LELIDLECFTTLAQELHFGRTATRLQLGTPSVSKHIADLERRLGVRLFDRTSRDVRLTPAGECLLPPAQRALAEVSVLRAMAADAAAGVIGGIRAAYSPGTGEIMTVLAHELTRRSPGVAVHPVQMISVRVAAAVRSGAAEVGIARVRPERDLLTMVLTELPQNAVALPVNHPLAGREELWPADLACETFLGPSFAIVGSHRQALTGHFREVDITTEGELYDLVSSGFGLLLTTEDGARRNPRHDVVIRRLAGAHSIERTFLIWRADNDSAVLRSFVGVAKEIRPRLTRENEESETAGF